MKIETYKAMKWLLTGVTFAAISASTGCATRYAENNSYAASSPAPADYETLEAAAANPHTTPAAVNPVGDVNGIASAPAPTGATNFQQHTYLSEGVDSDVAVDPTGKLIVF